MSDAHEAQKAQSLSAIAQVLQQILLELKLTREAQQRIAASHPLT